MIEANNTNVNIGNVNAKPKGVFKTLIFLGIAILVIAGNYFAEAKYAGESKVVEQKFSTFDYAKENLIPSQGIIRFPAGGKPDLKTEYAGDDHSYVFRLGSGNLWGDFTVSDAKVNILADRVVVIPDEAAFNLTFNGSKITLDVYSGDVYLGFLDQGIKVPQYLDRYSDIFMNTLLVPRDSRVTFPISKIDDRLKTLFHSKLVKEFQYSVIPAAEKNTDWVKNNLQADKNYREEIKQQVIADIGYKGALGNNTAMTRFLTWAESYLTFIPEKKTDRSFNYLFSYLNDAVYYANQGDRTKSDESFKAYNDYLPLVPEDVLTGDRFYEELDKYLNLLAVFAPNEDQYDILTSLLDQRFTQGKDQYGIVNKLWLGIYQAMDINPALAETALSKYYQYFNSTVGKSTDTGNYQKYIVYQNQLFDNLFFRYATFYRDGYFAIKNALEKEEMKLYSDDEVKEEFRQSLISNKIAFLKRLVNFFFKDEIEVDDVKQIMSRLIFEVRDLMPADSSGVAVIQLFEGQMENMVSVWGYMNSPEYYSSKTYGTNQQERYDAYLKDRDRIWSFVDIQEGVLGDKTVTNVSLEDVKNAINDVFAKNGVAEVTINDLTDTSRRYVNVGAVIGGYPFEADYDRDYELVKNIKVYGELVSDSPVKLSSLLDLFNRKFTTASKAKETLGGEITVETNAQRIAKIYIATKISALGFEATEGNVSVVDEKNAVYRVSNVYLAEQPGTLLTFDYLATKEKAANVFLMIDKEPLPLQGEFDLENLANLTSSGKDQLEREKAAKGAEASENILR